MIIGQNQLELPNPNEYIFTFSADPRKPLEFKKMHIQSDVNLTKVSNCETILQRNIHEPPEKSMNKSHQIII